VPNAPVVVETGEEVVARARSQIGLRTIYALGAGGRRPADARCTQGGKCDCSGFAAWCIGVDRFTQDPWYRTVNGGWLETSAIFRDLATPLGIVDAWEWAKAQPGMLLVWGDRKDGAGKVHQGHIGVVSRVDGGGPTHVIHCSQGNFYGVGDAIQETSVLLFIQHEARLAKVGWIDEGLAA
jgi:cell wall-associated NlpC family hydrolase